MKEEIFLDTYSLRLLAELQRDARQTVQQIAERVGLCAIGRATHTRFLCYTHPQRLVFDAIPAAPMAERRAASVARSEAA